jgi:hypothetical protein
VLVAILGTSACRWRLSHGVAGVRQRLEAACAKHGLQLAGPAGPAQLLGVVVLRSYQFIYETPASHPAKPPGHSGYRSHVLAVGVAFAAVGGRAQQVGSLRRGCWKGRRRSPLFCLRNTSPSPLRCHTAFASSFDVRAEVRSCGTS